MGAFEVTADGKDFARCGALYRILADSADTDGNPATAKLLRGQANGAELAATFQVAWRLDEREADASRAYAEVSELVEWASTYLLSMIELDAVDAIESAMADCVSRHDTQVLIVESALRQLDE